MRINGINWDNATVLHIALHGVEPEEVEEVCFKAQPLILKSRNNRYYCLGQAQSGRYLAIILEYLGNNKAKVITSRAMSGSERRLYRKR